MPYDEKLADRIRAIVGDNAGLREQRMFGGIAFMLNGNMFVGITRDDLMARVGPERYDEALTSPGARPADMSGRPMKGMVFVAPDGYNTDEQLRGWVERTLNFVRTLPAKKPKGL